MTKEQMCSFASFASEQAAYGGKLFGDGLMFTVQYGYVDSGNTVRHDGVKVLDAPPAFVTALLAWSKSDQLQDVSAVPVMVSVADGALFVH